MTADKEVLNMFRLKLQNLIYTRGAFVYFHRYLWRIVSNPRKWKQGVYRRYGIVSDYKFLKLSHQVTTRVNRGNKHV